jgi:hypothetical protein
MHRRQPDVPGRSIRVNSLPSDAYHRARLSEEPLTVEYVHREPLLHV